MRRLVNGFSLYELIAVLTIIGIGLGIALPVMSNLAMRRNNESTFLQLEAIIKYAQAEALRRGAPVNICAAAFNTVNGANATLNGCAAHSFGWTEGVLVYNDLNNSTNSGINSVGYDTGERIRAYRFDADVAITASTSNGTEIRSFIIGSNGRILTANTPFSFTFSQTKFGSANSRKVCINSYGHVCIKDEGNTSDCAADGDASCN